VHLLNNRVETITSNLGSFMELLAGQSFFRSSRSAMINLNYLIRVDYKSGTCRLRGESDIELKVARNRRQELDQVVRNS
jgi:DNA-binding LytR/AlgR family response regulator